MEGLAPALEAVEGQSLDKSRDVAEERISNHRQGPEVAFWSLGYASPADWSGCPVPVELLVWAQGVEQ